MWRTTDVSASRRETRWLNEGGTTHENGWQRISVGDLRATWGPTDTKMQQKVEQCCGGESDSDCCSTERQVGASTGHTGGESSHRKWALLVLFSSVHELKHSRGVLHGCWPWDAFNNSATSHHHGWQVRCHTDSSVTLVVLGLLGAGHGKLLMH